MADTLPLPLAPLPHPYPPPAAPRKIGAAATLAASSLAPSIAVLFTHPADTTKVRLQLQGEQLKRVATGSAAPPPVLYKNSFDCLRKTYAAEGIRGLQKGLSPAILREASKNLFRLGMYDTVLAALHPPPESPSEHATPPPPWKLIAAGSVCGAMGAASCNPFEVIKTRLQSAATGELAKVGHQHGYTGVWMGLRTIVRTEGWKGLYRGAGMSVARSVVGSGSNMAAFYMCKDWMMRPISKGGVLGWSDGVPVDTVGGLVSGFASVICMNPIDTLRTRLYNQPCDPATGRGLLYASGWDVFRKVTTAEGYGALYKGFASHFLRIGPHFCLTFMFLGIIKRATAGAMDARDARETFAALDAATNDGALDARELTRAARWCRVPDADMPAVVAQVLSKHSGSPGAAMAAAAMPAVPVTLFVAATADLAAAARTAWLRRVYSASGVSTGGVSALEARWNLPADTARTMMAYAGCPTTRIDEQAFESVVVRAADAMHVPVNESLLPPVAFDGPRSLADESRAAEALAPVVVQLWRDAAVMWAQEQAADALAAATAAQSRK
ncbi:mitochondrial carrier domain-containing protein [Blastocladiella britannica]|nr:mitochondrial carrier domain-containing protein [Blastocladiella britannica]